MNKILITGATGFVGRHLTELLLTDNNNSIFGTSLSGKDDGDNNIDIEKIDLSSYDDVLTLIDKIKPNQIYHLAALASAAESLSNATSVVLSNIEIQMNLLNAINEKKISDSRILIVSSAQIYGLVDKKDLPIDEDTPLMPNSPYAVSKIAQDFLGLQYHLTSNLDIIRVRPFNHTGPYQNASFAVPSFAKQIALIEKGGQDPILEVGNLDVKRDFTDVRDIAKGYTLLMEKGITGQVYNIGSGKSYSLREILDLLLSQTDKKIEIKQDPKKLRSSDVEDFYSDNKKLTSQTGWSPTIPLEKTLKDTLDYWRDIV